jgi:hypothetical protein
MKIKIKKPLRFIAAKTLYLGLVVLPMFCLASCVKQKKCDCPYVQKGKFVYLDKPEKQGTKKIVGYFVIDGNPFGYRIVGTVPKNYQKTDTIDVKVCLKTVTDVGRRLHYAFTYYELKCIEKED